MSRKRKTCPAGEFGSREVKTKPASGLLQRKLPKLDSFEEICRKFMSSKKRRKWWELWNEAAQRKVSLNNYYNPTVYDGFAEAFTTLMIEANSESMQLVQYLNPWNILYDLCAEVVVVYMLWGKQQTIQLVHSLFAELYAKSYLASRVEPARLVSGLAQRELVDFLLDLIDELEVDDPTSVPLHELLEQVYYNFAFFDKLERTDEEHKQECASLKRKKNTKMKTLKESSKSRRIKGSTHIDFKKRGANPNVLEIRVYC